MNALRKQQEDTIYKCYTEHNTPKYQIIHNMNTTTKKKRRDYFDGYMFTFTIFMFVSLVQRTQTRTSNT